MGRCLRGRERFGVGRVCLLFVGLSLIGACSVVAFVFCPGVVRSERALTAGAGPR